MEKLNVELNTSTKVPLGFAVTAITGIMGLSATYYMSSSRAENRLSIMEERMSYSQLQRDELRESVAKMDAKIERILGKLEEMERRRGYR